MGVKQLVIILLLFLFVIFIIGCTSEKTIQEQQQIISEQQKALAEKEQAIAENEKELAKSALKDEYQRYVDAITTDSINLENSISKWNALMDQVNKGGTVDITDMESAQRDYTDKANIIKPKIENLKTFINQNEAKLKELGVDTFQEKQDLDELLAKIQNNVRNMQTEIGKLQK